MTESAARLLDGLAVGALKLVLSAAVLVGGFSAVSDDDYARIVIAQRWAEAPALDASGTSWLPLPFWVYGVAFRLFGSSLGVARGVALVLGALAVVLVWRAALFLGAERRGALLGAALAAIFPYSAVLGAATVPEAPTAALAVLGAATLARPDFRDRLLGALALALACAARYEPWAVALVFALLTLRDALVLRQPRLALPALLALGVPALWMLHGVAVHGSAWFFVARVAAYRAALGPDTTLLSSWLRTPRDLFVAEPELALTAIGALLLAWRADRRGPASSGPPAGRPPQTMSSALAETTSGRASARFLAAIGAVAALSLLADLRGYAATHHAERALLPVWFGAALLVGRAWPGLWASLPRLVWGIPRANLAAVVTLALLVAGALVRQARPRPAFTDRHAETAIGERARQLGVARLAIDAPDYGFFAVQAAFGRPSATVVLDDRDPRKPRPPDLVARAPHELRQHLARQGIHWIAMPGKRAASAGALGTRRESTRGWALVEL